MEALLQEAKQIGQQNGYLDTLKSLIQANRRYQKLGFVKCDAYYANPLKDVVYYQIDLI